MSGAAVGSWSAFTSFVVSCVNELRKPPEPRPKPKPPGWIVTTFVPRPRSAADTATAEPWPTATRMITAATPIVIPSIVSSERRRFASTPWTAIRSASATLMPITVFGTSAARSFGGSACSAAVRRSESMRPSTRWTTRFAYAAMSASCVIITIVRPATFSREKICSTSAPARCRGCRSARRRGRSPAR